MGEPGGLALTRGAVIVGVHSGAYGKPRPGIVVQSDDYNETHASVVICPITSELVDAPSVRIPVEASASTGLREPSQIMTDKIAVMPRERIGAVIGRLDGATLERLDAAIILWLGLKGRA